MKRDMTFYKYCDIYMLICEMDDNYQVELITSAQQEGLETELLYCLSSINAFFDMPDGKLKTYAMERYNDALNNVTAPAEKKLYHYTERNVAKRFFAKNRLNLLEEKTK